jgi:glycosyltransferase involved in cell wall biosynthesis
MAAPKKILYIQHAAALGGSCVSLRETVQALDRNRFEPVIALARPSRLMTDYYRSAGIDTISGPPLEVWHHSTVAPSPLRRPDAWVRLARLAAHWQRTEERTLALVRDTRADLVHLNSAPLVPSARALRGAGLPFVWHVREPPRPSYGVRYRYIRRQMLHANELIFLSEFDRYQWVRGRRGEVIPNFVDLGSFDRKTDGGPTRDHLGVSRTAKVVLFAGGLAEVKGVFPLLDALAIVRGKVPDLVCLMPGAEYERSKGAGARFARRVLPVLGTGTPRQRVETKIRRLDLERTLVRMPFRPDMPALIAASDVVVFPSIRPHFARPVVEAAAMARPAVGSDLPGVRELIRHGMTGLLARAGSSRDLAAALTAVLTDDHLARCLGENAHREACNRFDAKACMAEIMNVYERILG